MARILVVDDQPLVTLCLSIFLTREGHDVVRADSGDEALDLIRSERFDLLITDVDMPGINGIQLATSEEVASRVRGIIVMTGRTDYRELNRICDRPCVDVVPKPVCVPTVIRTVNALLTSNHHAALISDTA